MNIIIYWSPFQNVLDLAGGKVRLKTLPFAESAIGQALQNYIGPDSVCLGGGACGTTVQSDHRGITTHIRR